MSDTAYSRPLNRLEHATYTNPNKKHPTRPGFELNRTNYKFQPTTATSEPSGPAISDDNLLFDDNHITNIKK